MQCINTRIIHKPCYRLENIERKQTLSILSDKESTYFYFDFHSVHSYDIVWLPMALLTAPSHNLPSNLISLGTVWMYTHSNFDAGTSQLSISMNATTIGYYTV